MTSTCGKQYSSTNYIVAGQVRRSTITIAMWSAQSPIVRQNYHSS